MPIIIVASIAAVVLLTLFFIVSLPLYSFISPDIFRSLTAYRTRYHIGAGSTFVEVSGKQIANMDLMMPTTIEEQQKIGSYFRNLDHLITLHQRKL